ncbi:MAG: O-antigen polymerase [Bacillota bacterium]|nr:MAG: O-antigen polymerase [Bacillota bacterium]
MKNKVRPVVAKKAGWSLNRYIDYVWFAVVFLLASALPWLRGLYWPLHRLGVQALLLVFIAFWVVAKTGKGPIKVTLLDALAVVLAMLYVLGIITPASMNGAIQGAITWVSLMALFLWVRSLRLGDKGRGIVVGGIAAAGVLWALLGMAAHNSLIKFPIWFQGARLAAGFEYPNAAAGFYLMALVLCLYSGFVSESKRVKWGYAAGAVVLLVALLLTQSRGAWLGLAITLLLSLWWLRARAVDFAVQAGLILAVGLATAGLVMARPSVLSMGLSLLAAVICGGLVSLIRPLGVRKSVAVIGGICILLLAGVLWLTMSPNVYTLKNITKDVVWQTITYGAGQLPAGDYRFEGTFKLAAQGDQPATGHVAVQVIGADNKGTAVGYGSFAESGSSRAVNFTVPPGVKRVEAVFSSGQPQTTVTLENPRIVGARSVTLKHYLHKALPHSIAARLSQMSWRSLAADGRLVFIEDGLKAVRQKPVFGFGGGAWNAVYHGVQSYFYGSGRAHADWLDITLEVGIVGLLIYLAIVIGSLMPFVRREQVNSKLGLGMASLAIFVHSFGEALLAFPSSYYFLTILLGVLSSRETERQIVFLPKIKGLKASTLVAIMLCACVTVGFWLAEVELQALFSEKKEMESVSALKSIDRVLLFNPYSFNAMMTKLDFLSQLPNNRNEYGAILKRAQYLEPHDPRVPNMLGWHYLLTAHFSDALVQFQRGKSLQPYNVQGYEMLAIAGARAAFSSAASGDGAWQGFAETVIDVEQEFLETRNAARQALLPLSIVPFEQGQPFMFAVGAAHALLGNFDAARTSFSKALEGSDQTLRDRSTLWLAWGLLRQGDNVQPLTMIERLLSQEAYLEEWNALLKISGGK